jgi:hypothetical protein
MATSERERSYAAGSLWAALGEVTDQRGRHGRRHSLASLLALAVCAMLCGCGSYAAASDWGRLHRPFCLEQLGFDPQKQLPCVATFSRVFRWLDAAEFERVIQQWIAGCLGIPPAEVTIELNAVAVDGKSARGTFGHGDLPGMHLLSAFSQRLKIPLAQSRVDLKTNEPKELLFLLKTLVLDGTVITGDAIFCQREVCEAIVDRQGDYLFVVKDNQPTLRRDIELCFAENPR